MSVKKPASGRGEDVESVFASLAYLLDRRAPAAEPPRGSEEPLAPELGEEDAPDEPTLIRPRLLRMAQSADETSEPAKRTGPFPLPKLRPRPARTLPPPPPPRPATPAAPSVLPQPPRSHPGADVAPLMPVEITRTQRSTVPRPRALRIRGVAIAALIAGTCFLARFLLVSTPSAALDAAPAAAPALASAVIVSCPRSAGAPTPAPPASTLEGATPAPLPSIAPRNAASRAARKPLGAPPAACSVAGPARHAIANYPSGRLFGTED
jgi:hypothetical protein